MLGNLIRFDPTKIRPGSITAKVGLASAVLMTGHGFALGLAFPEALLFGILASLVFGVVALILALLAKLGIRQDRPRRGGPQ